jgi:hypothetical protein
MRIAIQPKAGLTGNSAVTFEVSDSRVVSGKAAIAEVPAVPAQGTQGQEGYVPAVPAVPAVAAVPGNVDSQIAFYDASGRQLTAVRAQLTPEQYAAWDETVADDDAYFVQCHAANFGVVAA